jgi:hypothetical protein
MMDANIESLSNLRDNLQEQGINMDIFPMVIQYNKRDIPDVFSLEELNAALNPRDVPYFEAVAMSGDGVLKTFTSISKQVLQDMQKFPDRHNLALGDIMTKSEQREKEPQKKSPPPEPSIPGAPMAEARAEMAALEKAVDAGVRVDLGKPFMEYGQIVLPFNVVTKEKEEQFQMRVTLNMEAPAAKRFKIVVKSFKKE